jgi:hypothetical protein
MDRFRELEERRDLRSEARAVEGTMPLDARTSVERHGAARLN